MDELLSNEDAAFLERIEKIEKAITQSAEYNIK